MTATNGYAPPSRPFPNGVYCPLVTPFNEDETVNYTALEKQVVRLAQAKSGIVLLGTNGEAIHMTDEERQKATAVSRAALDKAGFPQVPLMVGCGGGSAFHSLKLIKEAKEAGADATIVIHPGYFAFAMGKNRAAVKAFFVEVLDKSVLPVMIYNFPGAAGGIDLDSDMLIELADHPNCIGAKLTCAGIGKGTRLAAHVQKQEFLARHQPCLVFPGFSDYLLPALVTGHQGCITGSANIFPKLIVKLYETAVQAIKTGDLQKWQEAQKLQLIVSELDWVIVKAGIGGTKYVLDKIAPGLGGSSRLPTPPVSEEVTAMCDKHLVEAIKIEQSL